MHCPAQETTSMLSLSNSLRHHMCFSLSETKCFLVNLVEVTGIAASNVSAVMRGGGTAPHKRVRGRMLWGQAEQLHPDDWPIDVLS